MINDVMLDEGGDLTLTISGLSDHRTEFQPVGTGGAPIAMDYVPTASADGSTTIAAPVLTGVTPLLSLGSVSDTAQSVTTSVSSAAAAASSAVSSAASSAAKSVGSALSGAWAKVSGKGDTPSIDLPVVSVSGAKVSASSSSDSSLLWLWLVLAGAAAFLVYKFTGTKGRRGGKLFSSLRSGGSKHVKSYGK